MTINQLAQEIIEQMKNYELGETPADPRPSDDELPVIGFEPKGNQFGLRELPIEFRELATNTMRANMTPAQKARSKAEAVSKDLFRAYEVGATMKDLDGVFSMWTRIVEKALLEASQPPEPKTTVQAAIELRDRATQVALNFAGQRISSSDGSYELLIQCVQDAMNDAIGLAFGAVESSALPGNPDHRCQCSECDPSL